MAQAISSSVGSRSSSARKVRSERLTLFSRSPTCTGILIVRPLSVRPRATACRIHQVAYVENLNPLRWSNFSAARTRPIVPSWIRSRKGSPWFLYLFAIETTSRRFASTISRFAPSSPRSMRFASSTSCAAVSRAEGGIRYEQGGRMVGAARRSRRQALAPGSRPWSRHSPRSRRRLVAVRVART